MFTSFTSYEVSLLISALQFASQADARFGFDQRKSMTDLAVRLNNEQAKHETTPIIEPCEVAPGDQAKGRTCTYRVRWEIDIEATSPTAAAERAREIQMDPYNIATFYKVAPYIAGSESTSDPYEVELGATPEPGPQPPETLKLSGTMREVAIERGLPVRDVELAPLTHAEMEGRVVSEPRKFADVPPPPLRTGAPISVLVEEVSEVPVWQFGVEAMHTGESMWRVCGGWGTMESARSHAETVSVTPEVCSVRIVHKQFVDPNVDSMCDSHMVCTGNPGDGFSYYGPFPGLEEAERWADAEVQGDWWVIELRKPT